MIEATAISVSHGSVPVLHGVDLQVRPGEIAAIIGPNGSGKTTLLKAIAGELRHGGQVRINGTELARLGPAAAAELRAVLPQASSMLFPFTVLEVVALGLLAGGQALTSEERRSRPGQALGRVGLAGFGGRFYSDLSGGEQQRVQLARVLCQVWHPVVDGAPRYLLLDEPVSSLDIKHQLQVMDVARQFADGGGGVIAILHDLNLAAMYADTITALSGGHLAGAGRPNEVLADAVLERVFDCPLRAGRVPDTAPFVLPQSVGGSSLPLSHHQARS